MIKRWQTWIYITWLVFLFIYAHSESDRFSTFLFLGFAIVGLAEAILFVLLRMFTKVDWSVDSVCTAVGSQLKISFKTRLAPFVPGIVDLSLRSPWSDPGEIRCNLSNSFTRSRQEMDFKLNPSRRGHYVIGPCLLTLEDPLGLFKVQLYQGSTKELWITPRLLDISHISSNFSGNGAQGEHLFYSGGASGGARKYQLGDPMQRIHWKATARMQTLMVREYETDNHTEVCLWLNLNREDYLGDTESLETAISLAATILSSYSSQGSPLTFWTTGSRFSKFHLQEPSGLDESLRYLAIAKANGSLTMEQALLSLPECSSLMMITGKVLPDFARKFNSVLRDSQKPLLMITGHKEEPSSRLSSISQWFEVSYWHKSSSLQGEV